MLYTFKCIDIDSDLRLQNDLEIKCWSERHSFFSLLIAIPSIIVWGVGIPTFALLFMIENRSKLT